MDKPLMSICIPTYNRCNYLQNSLNSIICQKEFLNGTVEVVISDNASTDGTPKLCEQYASYFSNIHYFRNVENVHDQNFPLALSRAHGEYRKLSGDKCLYRPNILGVWCDAVNKYKDEEKVLFFLNGRKYGSIGVLECKTFEQFVLRTTAATTSINCFGVWESKCDKVTSDLSGIELQLWQCKRIYEMVEAKDGAAIINCRWMDMQTIANKDMSYGVFKVLYLNLLTILQPYFERGLISENTINEVRKVQLNALLSSVLNQKIYNIKMSNTENTEELIRKELQLIGQNVDANKVKGRGYEIMRHLVKEIYMTFYTTLISFQVRHIMKK